MRSTTLVLRRALPYLASALAAGVALFAAEATAHATPTFPSVVARELGLGGEPSCSVCHAGGATRRGTVTTPLGTTLRSRGLVAYSEDTLVTALKAIEAENKDSDGDGTPDVAELRAGSDPNLAAGETAAEPPEYGCATSARGAGSDWSAGLLASLGLVRALRRRATTRSRRKRRL